MPGQGEGGSTFVFMRLCVFAPKLSFAVRPAGWICGGDVFALVFRRDRPRLRSDSLWGYEPPGYVPLTPDTVELIPTLGALSPRGGPVQDPVLTRRPPCVQVLELFHASLACYTE